MARAAAVAPPRPWVCPRCLRSFARRPGRHACERLTPGLVLGDDGAARAVHRAVTDHLLTLGPVQDDVTPTQVGWKAAGRPIAWLWLPCRVLRHGARDPVVTFPSSRAIVSPRIKESTRVGAHRWIHHAVVPTPADVDAELRSLLSQAYRAAAGDG